MAIKGCIQKLRLSAPDVGRQVAEAYRAKGEASARAKAEELLQGFEAERQDLIQQLQTPTNGKLLQNKAEYNPSMAPPVQPSGGNEGASTPGAGPVASTASPTAEAQGGVAAVRSAPAQTVDQSATTTTQEPKNAQQNAEASTVHGRVQQSQGPQEPGLVPTAEGGQGVPPGGPVRAEHAGGQGQKAVANKSEAPIMDSDVFQGVGIEGTDQKVTLSGAQVRPKVEALDNQIGWLRQLLDCLG